MSFRPSHPPPTSAPRRNLEAEFRRLLSVGPKFSELSVKEKGGSLAKNTTKCTICLEDIDNKWVCPNNCSAAFCKNCIERWASVNQTCPYCKGPWEGEFEPATHTDDALFDAIDIGNRDGVAPLLNSDNVNAVTDGGETPLHIACYNGHREIVQLLLSRDDIEVNKANNRGETPLYIACAESYSDVAGLLLGRDDIEVNKATRTGWAPLHIACKPGNRESVQLLLGRDDIEVNKANNRGETPLYLACLYGNRETVQLLLDKDADVDKANERGETPLYVACDRYGERLYMAATNGPYGTVNLILAKKNEIVQLLLAKNADVDKATTDKGITPFYMAASNGYADVVKLLLDKADVDKATRSGLTPLYAAAQNGYTEIVELIRAKKTEKRQRDAGGSSSSKRRKARQQLQEMLRLHLK